jgi:hypothetical protein
MRNSIQKVSLAIVLCLLISCSSEPEKKDADTALIQHVEKNRIGTSTDVWLETKSDITGDWDKVALFFGMIGDRGVCEAIVASLQKTPNSAAELRCTNANQPVQSSEEEELERLITNNQGDRVL